MTAVPVIYDTDGGVDDYSALWYALVAPGIDLVGITTVRGVVSAAQTAKNVAKVLDAAGRREVPFAVGAEETVAAGPELPPATLMHGPEGLGSANIPDVDLEAGGAAAADFIVEQVRRRPGEITLVAVGPFTNVALAIRQEPDLPELLGGLVIMGGVARPPGNATPLGEFNAVVDPQATHEMVHAAWPQPPVMVGLDVTLMATMGDAEFEVLNQRRSPQAAFMAEPFEGYRPLSSIEAYEGGCPSHDTLTMMSVAHPDLVRTEVLPLTVDTAGGPAWGTTVVDFRAQWFDRGLIPPELEEIARKELFEGKATWRIALGVDVEQFRQKIRAFYAGTLPA